MESQQQSMKIQEPLDHNIKTDFIHLFIFVSQILLR